VFLGGFDLPAAQAIADGGDVERYEVLDLLNPAPRPTRRILAGPATVRQAFMEKFIDVTTLTAGTVLTD
jgi:hypothetical protein